MTSPSDRLSAYEAVAGLAQWSPWSDFYESWSSAPLQPGVYLFRLRDSSEVVYVGMAGERSGSGGKPQGIRGRLGIYAKGRGAVSGFGEAALDRALGDESWLQAQLTDLQENGPKRAKVWAQDAMSFLAPEVSWAVCADRESAIALESEVEQLLGMHGLWNRASQSRRAAAAAGGDDTRAEPGAIAPPPDDPTVPASGTTFTLKGFTIDLDVLFRRMSDLSQDEDGVRVYNGNRRDTPGMKRLLNELFEVPVLDSIHPVNHAVRSECRDRLHALGWATKDPGRSARYVLHRDV